MVASLHDLFDRRVAGGTVEMVYRTRLFFGRPR
jgi:hypothetical protein